MDSNQNYLQLKGASITNGLLGPHGIILRNYLSPGDAALSFTLANPGNDDFSFVFGFRGAGNYLRLDFRKSLNRFVLSQISDGMLLYLNHAIINSKQTSSLRIIAQELSISLYLDDLCFMNIFHEAPPEGRWGFTGTGLPSKILEVTVDRIDKNKFEWVILGDGYNNNRWKNRDFFSWPEFVFGDKVAYLNACVAAGNTRRVLEIVTTLGRQLEATNVIIAVGADDVMELEDTNMVRSRMLEIVRRLRQNGVTKIHASTLVPKPRFPDQIKSLNHWITTQLAASCDSVIDFHGILENEQDSLLVNGDFPGSQAQLRMATKVLDCFFDGMAPSALSKEAITKKRTDGDKRIAARIAARTGAYIDRFLGRI